MSNINLYQDEQASEKSVQAGIFGNGLIIGAVIFVIVLVCYGGLKVYLRDLDQKITDSRAEEISGRNTLKSGDVNLAASFGQRLDMLEVGKEVFVKNDPAGVFQAVQNVMIQGVVASQIGFQEKTLNVSFVADNFEVLAKQILNFKKNSAFQSVEVKSSTKGENGKVSAELAMTLSL